jgi:hypothetical protein
MKYLFAVLAVLAVSCTQNAPYQPEQMVTVHAYFNRSKASWQQNPECMIFGDGKLIHVIRTDYQLDSFRAPQGRELRAEFYASGVSGCAIRDTIATAGMIWNIK